MRTGAEGVARACKTSSDPAVCSVFLVRWFTSWSIASLNTSARRLSLSHRFGVFAQAALFGQVVHQQLLLRHLMRFAQSQRVLMLSWCCSRRFRASTACAASCSAIRASSEQKWDRAVVMSDPERAQRFAGLVVQGNDQVFDDRRLGIAQGSERALRSRYADRRAGIQTKPAGAGITGRVCAFVRSQRPADRRPAHDRLARAIVTQQAQASAAGVAQSHVRCRGGAARLRRGRRRESSIARRTQLLRLASPAQLCADAISLGSRRDRCGRFTAAAIVECSRVQSLRREFSRPTVRHRTQACGICVHDASR